MAKVEKKTESKEQKLEKSVNKVSKSSYSKKKKVKSTTNTASKGVTAVVRETSTNFIA